MKKGAYIGAVLALFLYMFMPIYGDNGAPASLFPTANAITDVESYNGFIDNIPSSMMLFFTFEVLGISIGIAAEMVIRRNSADVLNSK